MKLLGFVGSHNDPFTIGVMFFKSFESSILDPIVRIIIIFTKSLLRAYMTLANGDKMKLSIVDVIIDSPSVPAGTVSVKNHKIYPAECRQRKATYKGKMTIKVTWAVNGKQQEILDKKFRRSTNYDKSKLWIFFLKNDQLIHSLTTFSIFNFLQETALLFI